MNAELIAELPRNMQTKIAVVESGCWQWTGARNDYGYGAITLAGKCFRAHRVTYVYLVGVIPDGMVLDHLCRNTSCVNPDHLEPVTQKVNVHRGDAVGPGSRRGRPREPWPFRQRSIWPRTLRPRGPQTEGATEAA